VALDDWYPVADAEPVPPRETGLLRHPIRVWPGDGRPRVRDVASGRELPVTERFGVLWTTLGAPRTDVFDVVPQAHEPDRRYVRCGWVTLRTSAPRIIENFLDMAHFPYVHAGVLGAEPWTDVPDYHAEVRRDVDEVWATNCRFFQPRVAATESAGAYAGGSATRA